MEIQIYQYKLTESLRRLIFEKNFLLFTKKSSILNNEMFNTLIFLYINLFKFIFNKQQRKQITLHTFKSPICHRKIGNNHTI